MNTAVNPPFVRKITPKSVSEILGINLLQLQRPVQPRNLYDLVGIVMGATIKADKSGTKADSVQFRGEFNALDCETGQILCESGVMYVPVMDSVLYTTVRTALAADPKAQIAVALRVAIKTAPADKPSMTGYEFDVQRIIPQNHQEDTPMQRLRQLARQNAVALPAPGTVPRPVGGIASSGAGAGAEDPSEARGSRRVAGKASA